MRGIAIGLGLLCLAAGAPTAREAPLGVEDCVRIAIGESPAVEQAEAKVQEWEARLAEVESVYYPKIAGLMWVAPNYTVEGTGIGEPLTTRWKSIEDWGTTLHVEARVIQPLWTFGRSVAAEEAATQRIGVERSRVREVQLRVAFEVRTLYYTHLYALSLLPTMDTALDVVRRATERADELYAAGTGEVTQADRQKLRYGATELKKARLRAADGADLALWALAHAMGMERTPTLVEERLPPVPSPATTDLPTLIAQARTGRPEWDRAAHGAEAARFWEQAERRAMHPVLFAAAQITMDWTPTREDPTNPYLYDPYNGIVGGIALGLSWDFDPALAGAKADGARATGAQVAALTRIADTGIPLQVRRAWQRVDQTRQLADLAAEGVEATRKWMTFAEVAYNAGTGEARDVLEGVAAYAKARHDHYEAVRDHFVARAALELAIGQIAEEATSASGGPARGSLGAAP